MHSEPSWEELQKKAAEIDRQRKKQEAEETQRQEAERKRAEAITPSQEQWCELFDEFFLALDRASRIELRTDSGHHQIVDDSLRSHEEQIQGVDQVHFVDPESTLVDHPKAQVRVTLFFCEEKTCDVHRPVRSLLRRLGWMPQLYSGSSRFPKAMNASPSVTVKCLRAKNRGIEADWSVSYYGYEWREEAPEYNRRAEWSYGARTSVASGVLFSPRKCEVKDRLDAMYADGDDMSEAFRKTRMAMADFARKYKVPLK